jgi:hypothetical protein
MRAAPLLGVVHVALLAWIVLELPLRVGVRNLVLVAAILAGPHVFGAPGRVLFAADRWFRADVFPDPVRAFGPILVLVSIACALHGLRGTLRPRTDPQ